MSADSSTFLWARILDWNHTSGLVDKDNVVLARLDFLWAQRTTPYHHFYGLAFSCHLNIMESVDRTTKICAFWKSDQSRWPSPRFAQSQSLVLYQIQPTLHSKFSVRYSFLIQHRNNVVLDAISPSCWDLNDAGYSCWLVLYQGTPLTVWWTPQRPFDFSKHSECPCWCRIAATYRQIRPEAIHLPWRACRSFLDYG